jgi:hypothetical protein
MTKIFINMKNILLLSFLFLIICGLKAQDNNPVFSAVNSIEINDQCGVFQFTVDYVFLDSISIQRSSQILAPNGWNVSLTPNLAGGVYEKGDSINVIVTVQYPVESIPFYSQTIQILNYADSAAESFEIYTIAKVFFTPYNTIEIWNMEDFSNLPRRWYTEDNAPFRQRLPISKNSIPVSNINIEVPVAWYDASRNWEDDNLDDFREVYIPGLAYSVLMKPIPDDSIAYYHSFGDGVDSAYTTDDMRERGCLGKWFSGTVSGKIEASITNDIGQEKTISLAGIKIRLKENDFYGWEEFESTYTNEDGEFIISYDECQLMEGNYVELAIEVVAATDDEYKITASNSWGNRYEFLSQYWLSPQNATPYTYNFTFSDIYYSSFAPLNTLI